MVLRELEVTGLETFAEGGRLYWDGLFGGNMRRRASDLVLTIVLRLGCSGAGGSGLLVSLGDDTFAPVMYGGGNSASFSWIRWLTSFKD
jgi:hypothetical protein